MKKHLFFLVLLFPFVFSYSFTRKDQLPKGFVWSYLPDEAASQPRGGFAWRAGLISGGRIFILSTDTLTALDSQGQKLWSYLLPEKGINSEAKIIPLGSDALTVITTDSILKISIKTGEMISFYTYDSSKKSAFQRTLILPRYSFLYEDSIYGFLGPTLLKFDTNALERTEIKDFNSSPKTLPLIYDNSIAVGLENGFFELYNPATGESDVLISGSSVNFTIRQPVIRNGLLFIPVSDEFLVYQGKELFARNKNLTNAIISSLGGRLWLRGHNTGLIAEIDETLSSLVEGRYASPLRASAIDAPLSGTSNRLLHVETLNGALTVMDVSDNRINIIKNLVTEDFNENPPLQVLSSSDNMVLLGGFDGVFLLDLNLF